MWEELERALDAEPVYDAGTLLPRADAPAVAQVPNPFVRFVDHGGRRLQSIEGDYLVIVDRRESNAASYYMLSPTDALSVRLPEAADRLVSLHRHDYLEIVILLKGTLDFLVEGARSRYLAGDCTVINQNVLHRELPGGGGRLVVYVSLKADYLRGLGLRGTAGDGTTPFSFFERNLAPGTSVDYIDLMPINRERAMRELEPTLTALVRELACRRPGYADIVRGLIVRLLHTLQDLSRFSCANTRYPRSGDDGVFERTLAFVQERRCRLRRDEVARALNYNGNYLNDVFLEHTGITLGAYIRTVCLQEAARLLLNTDLSVAQIISRLRYDSRASFYAHFKRRYGMTPAAYRSRTGR